MYVFYLIYKGNLCACCPASLPPDERADWLTGTGLHVNHDFGQLIGANRDGRRLLLGKFFDESWRLYELFVVGVLILRQKTFHCDKKWRRSEVVSLPAGSSLV